MDRHRAIRSYLSAAFIGALIILPLVAIAQQSSKVWKVGFIASGGSRAAEVDEFRKGMRELGYREGKNLFIEERFADGYNDRLPALAADIVKRNVDVIIVSGTPALAAMKRATSTVPIVMTTVGDPVASGFVASLARPGGNITGLSLANTDLSTKWVELAKTVSAGAPIGVLSDTRQETGPRYIKNIQSVARNLGISVPAAFASKADEFEAAFGSLAQERVAVVIVLPSGFFATHAEQIAKLAITHHMAAIATTRQYAQQGALLSYGQNYGEFTRKGAIYVDKIFKGARPAELPIEQPTFVELVVNLTTAKRLGLNIPKELVLRADTVIE